MITKTGAELLRKEAGMMLPLAAVGGVVGAARASSLSDKDIETLREHYDLPSDYSPVLRSAGRGALGGAGGAVAGALGGVSLGAILGALKGGAAGSVGGALAGAMLTPITAGAGGLYGAYKATNKYSKGRARELRGIPA